MSKAGGRQRFKFCFEVKAGLYVYVVESLWRVLKVSVQTFGENIQANCDIKSYAS